MRKVITAVWALVASGAFAAYQYEISGYPPSTATSSASVTCQVRTGRVSRQIVAESVDSRFRTMLESVPIKLLTTPIRGFIVTIR